jgi:hypothetical protein
MSGLLARVYPRPGVVYKSLNIGDSVPTVGGFACIPLGNNFLHRCDGVVYGHRDRQGLSDDHREGVSRQPDLGWSTPAVHESGTQRNAALERAYHERSMAVGSYFIGQSAREMPLAEACNTKKWKLKTTPL